MTFRGRIAGLGATMHETPEERMGGKGSAVAAITTVCEERRSGPLSS